MQIVIEMSDDYYEILKYEGQQPNAHVFAKLVANGTPLPKGHGRLIDADILRSMYSINRANFNTVVGIQCIQLTEQTSIQLLEYKNGLIMHPQS